MSEFAQETAAKAHYPQDGRVSAGLNKAIANGPLDSLDKQLQEYRAQITSIASRLERAGDAVFGTTPKAVREKDETEPSPDGKLSRIHYSMSDLREAINQLEIQATRLCSIDTN